MIVIGEDFRFGHLRMGDVALLQHLGGRLGFVVSVVPPFKQDGLRVSSTLIRQVLVEGDLQAATRLLGHPYFICGRVACGDQIGRQLGFPTANIYLDHRTVPIQGVFAVRVNGIAGESLSGVASLGTRPTVHGTRKVLEVYLFDFNQAIYGRMICVQFCEKLRDEVYFENLDLLKEQIIKDVAIARAYHAKRST
ncbi:MAG: hypothetical protein ACD_45C00553G0002 [uncultured bacterium]|nr:MAG: hypothetical protein ACD_45C00553G0002 [uncultured bacterium]